MTIPATHTTDNSLLTYLAGLRMLCAGDTPVKKSQGTIRAKGKCPICKEKFTELKGIGFVCLEHRTTPKKVYVDLPWKGERIRIFSDKTGKPLDSCTRAEEVLKHLHYEITNHIFDPAKYVTAEASKFWTSNLLEKFKESRVKTLAPAYKAHFSSRADLAGEFFKGQDVRDIRKIDLVNFKDHLEKTFVWKAKTLKNVLDIFRVFMGWVKNDLELIDRVPPFPKIEVADAPFKWIGQKDQAELFERVPDGDKPIIAFLMLHGCRPGEARALKCGDIDLDHDSITIGATFSGNVYCQRRKGRGARVAVIPIHPEMRGCLEERLKNSLPQAFVFLNPRTGTHYSENALENIWHAVRKATGISKELRLYDACRHSFASQLVNSGVSLFTVSKLLGHSSTKVTEKYSHASLDSLRTEVSRLTLKKLQIVTNLSPRKNDTGKK